MRQTFYKIPILPARAEPNAIKQKKKKIVDDMFTLIKKISLNFRINFL
jgi:hypothetical protein